ncbi:DUF1254 domain-containing protein [Serratia sp. BIGb0163]|uniref:DUF1254 domain-containing protein n=1 Tax=Serratia sp. BIGb0163 TaxID=2940613 RepID=UPI0021689FA1|nr:DUF1254 domain-containing protein [Serratia sp. BIGb0163]MCS4266471.1 hypothetical protein [Serratia sp. BIGb0163]
MKMTRRSVVLGGLGLLAGTAMPRAVLAEPGAFYDLAEGPDDLGLAAEAYIFGYPLVTMELTRRVMSNVAETEGMRGPMGEIVKMRNYPDASFRDVTAPNADTLYTNAFFDVGSEPWILSIPDMKGRYFLMPMLDGWTTVFQVPGKRTTGTGAQTYAITGPGWKGTLPAGVQEYKSGTDIVWMLGRIYCTGTPEDYAAVHRLQDEFRLVPLSAYGKPYTPPRGKVDASVNMKTAVRDQVNRMDGVSYFTLLCELMKTNPPSVDDASSIARFERIGIIPGQDFDKNKLKAEFARRVPDIAYERIMQQFKSLDSGNGWSYTLNTGRYGTDYLMRAFVTAVGLGANLPEDAIYPISKADGERQKYSGSNKYVVRFPKGHLPPVEGFWSLTMYDSGYFFVNNPLNRYSISPRQNLQVNPDGSTDLYIQKDSPGKDKESNWLPAPPGDFMLMLRLYWPSETDPSLINGTWNIPAVQKVD